MALLTEKITVAEAHEWLRQASMTWGLTAHEAESFAEDMTSLRPKDFKAPKAKRGPNKNSLTLEERRDAPYDPLKCDAGVYAGPRVGGFRVQCKCKAEGVCKTHQKVVDKHGMPRDGFYNQERPVYPFNDESQAPTPWEGVEVVSKRKSANKSGGERKETTCGHCGEVGHNKRTCPNKDSPAKKPKKSLEDEKAELLKKLAAVEKKQCEEQEDKEASETETEVKESVDSMISATESNGAAEELNVDTTEYSCGDTEVEDKEINVEDEDNDETIDCSFEGVQYVRDETGTVFDMPEMDPVGEWDKENECIVFEKQALKTHKKMRDPSYN